MRSSAGYLLAAALAASCGLTSALPAGAGDGHDRIYADFFGNLVIHNPGGEKRIVVGAGSLAGELTAYSRPRGPETYAHDDEAPVVDRTIRVTRYHCYSHGALVKGRSYMYGLEEGELPILGCE